jgi:pimeloyl-ACP methyl ester carboxylesterase
MKDIAFREKELQTWLELFPQARLIRLEDAGHYPQEEKPAVVTEVLRG